MRTNENYLKNIGCKTCEGRDCGFKCNQWTDGPRMPLVRSLQLEVHMCEGDKGWALNHRPKGKEKKGGTKICRLPGV